MKVTKKAPRDQIDCIEACRKINNRFHDKEGWHSHTTFLECRLCQNSISVYLHHEDMELIIHHPENDNRLDHEEKGKPWLPYLIEQVKQRLQQISAVKF
jgi:hypothetical protein